MEDYDAGKEVEEEVDYNFDEQEEEENLAGTGDDGHLSPEDLYGDLYDGEGISNELQSLDVFELQQKAASLAKTVQQLQDKLASVTAERDTLQAERAILVRNMSCIFKTAQLEIQRKDEQLRELRQPRPGLPPS